MINPAPSIDHTLLRADTVSADILRLCEEAVEHGFAAVCIPPLFVPLAADCLYGSEVTVATVVGFPLGYVATASKVEETARAVTGGAAEIDMVIAIGAALEGKVREVEAEIAEVVGAAGDARVKVILECCYFDALQQQRLVEAAVRARAAFVKTSTGFGPKGATLEDVAHLTRCAAGRTQVKAAGGIRDYAQFQAFLQAGANRIGTSSGVAIMEQWRAAEGL